MWAMLNKMSVESPGEYEQFVGEQLKKGKVQDDLADGSSGGRMIRPKAGFCIKCITTGNDGLKVRDFNHHIGKDFFINFCSHEALEPPKDSRGRPMLDDRASADGMEIPLVVGPHRDIDENSIGIDVVLHPVLIRRCENYNIFKSQVIDLALEWVAKECPVQFNPKYKLVDAPYIGGRGEEKSTPVLLPVDEVLERQAAGESGMTSATSIEPFTILQSVKQAQEDPDVEDTPLVLVCICIFFVICYGHRSYRISTVWITYYQETGTKKTRKKNIIQEIGPDGSILPTSEEKCDVDTPPRDATNVSYRKFGVMSRY